MASTEEEGTEATADQLGSMTLGVCKERKKNGEPTTENGTTPTRFCSACGKKSDSVKKCTACKCVLYCDKGCQNKHRKEHKKACKRIKKELEKRGGKLNVGKENEIGPIGKPPREECPICMRSLPIHISLQRYHDCCGKTVCGGCSLQHQIKSGEQAAKRGQSPLPPPTCAFCRETVPRSTEEMLARRFERIKRNDPVAMAGLGSDYGYGRHGLPLDQTKCLDLLRQSADLGCSDAHYQLGSFHNTCAMGLEQNEEEALKYFEKAAEGGHLVSRHNLGWFAKDTYGDSAAMPHWRLAASGGFKKSMILLTECFEIGLLHHSDLAETLQTFYRARAEMKSKDREQYIAYLKRRGEYEAEYAM